MRQEVKTCTEKGMQCIEAEKNARFADRAIQVGAGRQFSQLGRGELTLSLLALLHALLTRNLHELLLELILFHAELIECLLLVRHDWGHIVAVGKGKPEYR
jgi:hypothetical protein